VICNCIPIPSYSAQGKKYTVSFSKSWIHLSHLWEKRKWEVNLLPAINRWADPPSPISCIVTELLFTFYGSITMPENGSLWNISLVLMFLFMHDIKISDLCPHLRYWIEMMTHTFQQQGFLQDTNVKNKSYTPCKKRFHHKHPGAGVLILSAIFEFVKKVYSTGSFWDKKYTR
jgi:hypothetical protein